MKSITAILIAFLLIQSASAGDSVASVDGSPAISYSGGKIAEGTEWETEFFVADSGTSGPTVLIIGGMHGNEPAGSRAAEQILHWPIKLGKLVVVPRANVLGLEANTRLIPGQLDEAGDLDRNFPQDDPNDESQVKPRGKLAAALWTFAVKVKPDWVIDLHEGFVNHIGDMQAIDHGIGRHTGEVGAPRDERDVHAERRHRCDHPWVSARIILDVEARISESDRKNR